MMEELGEFRELVLGAGFSSREAAMQHLRERYAGEPMILISIIAPDGPIPIYVKDMNANAPAIAWAIVHEDVLFKVARQFSKQ